MAASVGPEAANRGVLPLNKKVLRQKYQANSQKMLWEIFRKYFRISRDLET